MNHQNLLDQAKIFALKVDYISVSTLQRKLLIGYNQATKILEILIREGKRWFHMFEQLKAYL